MVAAAAGRRLGIGFRVSHRERLELEVALQLVCWPPARSDYDCRSNRCIDHAHQSSRKIHAHRAGLRESSWRRAGQRRQSSGQQHGKLSGQLGGLAAQAKAIRPARMG